MPGLASFTQNLAVGQRVKIDTRGNTIFMRQTTEEILVRARSTQVGAGSGEEYKQKMLAAEKWFTAEEFDSVSIENLGVAATTVEIVTGFGDFFKPVPDIVNVAFSIPAARTITTIADKVNIDIGQAGKEQLAAENLTRTGIVVTALSTNTDIIRVGDTNVDTDRGTPLEAGQTIEFPNTAAVFACSEAANDQAAAVTENVT